MIAIAGYAMNAIRKSVEDKMLVDGWNFFLHLDVGYSVLSVGYSYLPSLCDGWQRLACATRRYATHFLSAWATSCPSYVAAPLLVSQVVTKAPLSSH